MKRFLGTVFVLLLLVVGLAWGLSAHVVRDTRAQVAGQMTASGYDSTIGLAALQETGGLDCIIVLGCGLSPDGGPSPMLEDRLETAVAMYREGYADKILVTGDNGTVEYNEIQPMREYLEEQGLPDEAIVCDYAGFSTYDSMYRARHIFGVERALVVTQGYHLSRALYIGNALGMQLYGAAADQETFSGQRLRDLREIVARDKDYFMCIFKPEAKIMGEPIEI